MVILFVNIEDKQKLAQKINAEIRKLSAYTGQKPDEYAAPEPDSTVKIETLAIQAVDRHTLAEARRKIASLHKALAGIDDKNFGLCMDCGTMIPLDRLLVVPDTDKCTECAA